MLLQQAWHMWGSCPHVRGSCTLLVYPHVRGSCTLFLCPHVRGSCTLLLCPQITLFLVTNLPTRPCLLTQAIDVHGHPPKRVIGGARHPGQVLRAELRQPSAALLHLRQSSHTGQPAHKHKGSAPHTPGSQHTSTRDELLTHQAASTQARDELLTHRAATTQARDELLTHRAASTQARDELHPLRLSLPPFPHFFLCSSPPHLHTPRSHPLPLLSTYPPPCLCPGLLHTLTLPPLPRPAHPNPNPTPLPRPAAHLLHNRWVL